MEAVPYSEATVNFKGRVHGVMSHNGSSCHGSHFRSAAETVASASVMEIYVMKWSVVQVYAITTLYCTVLSVQYCTELYCIVLRPSSCIK
jgi:hypothetical protein